MAFAEKHDFTRVIVEYNGMWQLNSLFRALPENWLVYQEIFTADSTTIVNYNANMRALVVDKLQSCEVIVFNRYNDSIDKNELHKVVRGSSRKAAIGYEYEDGTFEQDTIEAPLPYDLGADVVMIADDDYAVFYRDLSEEMDKYIQENQIKCPVCGKFDWTPVRQFKLMFETHRGVVEGDSCREFHLGTHRGLPHLLS